MNPVGGSMWLVKSRGMDWVLNILGWLVVVRGDRGKLEGGGVKLV